MNRYQLKCVLRGVSPMVWRRLLIPAETSLATLHQIIQIIYHWDNDYLHQFHIHGEDYGISYAGGIAFSHDAREVFIDGFGFDTGDKFHYQYNFFKNYIIDIRVENIEKAPLEGIAHCLKGNGMPGVTKYDAIQPTINLLKALS